jgi:aryl-alcohol dehydrogenase-like predicted oxidoreductase
MKHKSSRRTFLQAGLMVPAAGLISSGNPETVFQAPGKVVYRTLGKTGLKPSAIGYGLGQYPDPDIIARCIELGINYFDTGRIYGGGHSERMFAIAIRGKRDKVLISTKSSEMKKEAILKDIETSLQVLGTDHVDVWHLHGRDTPERAPEEAIEALHIIKKQGKARAIGFSTHDPNNMVDYAIKCKLDVVQTSYSYVIGGVYRDAAIKKLHDAGIGVVAMKPVIGLTSAPKERGPQPDYFNERMLKAYGFTTPPTDFIYQPALKAGEETGVAALKWVLRNPGISTCVPHHESVHELEMNVRAMTGSYTPADEKLLYVRGQENGPLYCRMCYQCKGQCPKGVPVTDELRFLAYNDFGRSLHQARLSFMELPREVRNLRCSDCSSCAIKCPNGVKVQERLIRAQELLA